MKRLLMLGGLRYLIPVIKKAKEMGHHVITCDYLPHNIAHQYSDEYYNVSIIDKDAVLELAQSLQIDGIMSFAVDPGVLTAAYVSAKMELPSPGPHKSVQILQNKGLFRKFLEENGFNTPNFHSYSNIVEALQEFDRNSLPVIVKPVDAAGSKGVTKVTQYDDLEPAIIRALKFSYSKKFIIEDFIESQGFASDTDSFSINGNLSFVSFNNQRFDSHSPNPYTPSAFSWPSSISKENQEVLMDELQRLIDLLGMKNSIYNIEVREGKDGKMYIMEVAPRGGGNRLSEMLQYATGADLITCAIQAALGERIDNLDQPVYSGNWGEVILHSNKSGRFKELKIADEIVKNVVEIDLWVREGDVVREVTAANDTIGTLVLNFDTQRRLNTVMSNLNRYIEILVE